MSRRQNALRTICPHTCIKQDKNPKLPATQSSTQARHQYQPSAVSATPATQSASPCHQVPRLPRNVTVHVSHAKSSATSRTPARHQFQPSAVSATPATQSASACHQVPRLPRKVTVHVRKCHACHAKSSATSRTPARHQFQPSAVSATPATQSDSRCHQVPRLPRKLTVHATKCHACHAKCAAPSRNPATPPRVTSSSPVP